MEAVMVCCSECDSRLGTLPNLWTQIGKGRISPVIQAGDSWKISPVGAIGQGEKGTIVDSCRVQEVFCNQCRSILGSQCLSSPVNHVLHEGQLLLRISSIQIKNPISHATIKPIIQRKLNLKNPPTDNLQAEDYDRCDDNNHRQPIEKGPEISLILDNIDAQREEIERLDAVGYQVVTSFNQAVHRINHEVGKLKNEMAQVTDRSSDASTRNMALENDIMSTKAEIREIKRAIQSSVSQNQLEQESLSMKNAIGKVDTCLQVEFRDNWEKCLLEGAHATAKTALAATDVATEETGALKAEVQHLRRELAAERSYNPSYASPVFASREMDILTSNITKIGHRASQVETLRMEFELLKGRVQRMETQAPPLTPQQPSHHEPSATRAPKF
ncbi:hypothetical protein F5X97DRAFT_4887 [Nemania serpens]|nr:hypothetical protein F5X97DRAFT_4887 [Nemania serpens]